MFFIINRDSLSHVHLRTHAFLDTQHYESITKHTDLHEQSKRPERKSDYWEAASQDKQRNTMITVNEC